MSAEELSNSSNIVGKGTFLEGNIETFGNIRVEGKIKGNVKSKSKVALGKSSQVEGNILAQNAEIAGEVKGIIEISEMLTLKPSAVINGDIITSKMVVESGAVLNGTCKMGVTIKEINIGENGQSQSKESSLKPPKSEGIKPN
ncbi:MAG: bactofilin family protein [Candidatus Cyclobacteriaceae bacterium M3_2C_046]